MVESQSKKSGTIIDADMLLARRSEGGQCLQHHQLSFFLFLCLGLGLQAKMTYFFSYIWWVAILNPVNVQPIYVC